MRATSAARGRRRARSCAAPAAAATILRALGRRATVGQRQIRRAQRARDARRAAQRVPVARVGSGEGRLCGELRDRGLAHAITLPSKQRLRGKTNLVAAACEGDIFDALGLEWREPWERECVVSPLDSTCRIGCAVDSAGAQPDSRGVDPASQ